MRLCLISSMFPLPGESPSLGPDNVVFNLARGLSIAEKSLSIDILTVRKDIDHFIIDHLFPNVRVYYFPALKGLPRSLGDPIIIRDFLQKHDYDLIHAHYPISLAKVLNLNVPKIVTLHGIYWKERNIVRNPFLRIGYYDYNTYMLKKILQNIDAFVAISPYVIEELKEKKLYDCIKKVFQINNPIDIDYFNVEKKNQDNINQDIILLYPATLNARKNQIAAINAIKEVITEIENVKLILTGGCSKSYLQKITTLIDEKKLSNIVEYRGRVSKDELLELYSKASIVYLLSRQETQPMVILESMATSNPIIASNIKSNSYLVKNGITGYLVDFNDISKITGYTIELINDEKKRIAMGKNAKEICKNEYYPDIIIAQTLKMYRTVLEGKE